MDGRATRNCLTPVLALARFGMLAVLLIPLAGCGIFGGGTNPPHVRAMQHPLLPGIPVPDGFDFVPDRSVGRFSGAMRVAKYEFKGSMGVPRVMQFYEEEMPKAGFNQTQKRFDEGSAYLRFTSPTEECVVNTKRTHWHTELTLDVGPLPQTLPSDLPKAEPPAGPNSPPPSRPK